MSPPPPPIHILRTHTASVTCLTLSQDGQHLYSGDTSGFAIATSLSSLRPRTKWKPHSDSILGIAEWISSEGPRIITHARDNKLHFWTNIATSSETAASSQHNITTSAIESLPVPELCFSMDVNALNFCVFSLVQGLPTYIALPNLVESSEIDIWSISPPDRIHAAIGRAEAASNTGDGGRGGAGNVMALHIFHDESGRSEDEPSSSLRLCAAYEFGGVILRKYNNPGKAKSVEGRGWEVIWSHKPHVDSVMAMQVSMDTSFAVSVSADNLVVKYSIAEGTCKIHRTKYAGNGCIAIRQDGRIFAVGGWDGRIRLYSAKSFKDLGTLKYDKDQSQALLFLDQSLSLDTTTKTVDDKGDLETPSRENWLAAGGKNGRIAIWNLKDFSTSKRS